MIIISRNEAKESGKKLYFTGNPCPKGHIAERFVCNGGCVECGRSRGRTSHNREIQKVWARNHPRLRQQPESQRFYGLKHRYGLSIKDFDEIIFNQDGKCVCCGINLESLPTRHIHVDHDHDTGDIRGVLCRKCNLGVGYIEHPLSNVWRDYINQRKVNKLQYGPELFQRCPFKSSAGLDLLFKIDCDAHTIAEYDLFAELVILHLYKDFQFRKVSGVPKGKSNGRDNGRLFARAVRRHISLYTGDTTLIVDDVLITGASMEAEKTLQGGRCLGAVIFARGPCPEWVRPVFTLNELCW